MVNYLTEPVDPIAPLGLRLLSEGGPSRTSVQELDSSEDGGADLWKLDSLSERPLTEDCCEKLPGLYTQPCSKESPLMAARKPFVLDKAVVRFNSSVKGLKRAGTAFVHFPREFYVASYHAL